MEVAAITMEATTRGVEEAAVAVDGGCAGGIEVCDHRGE
jgi:hypothetical protein